MVGECPKCWVKVKMSRYAKSVAANLIIEDKAGKKYRVTTFNEVVDDIY